MVAAAVWVFVLVCFFFSLVWFLLQTPHGCRQGYHTGITICDLAYVGESNGRTHLANVTLLLYRTLTFAYTLFWLLYMFANHDKIWFYYTSWSWFLLYLYFGMALLCTLTVVYRHVCAEVPNICRPVCAYFHNVTLFPTLALIMQNCMLPNTVVVTVGYWLLVFDPKDWDAQTSKDQGMSINFHGVNFLLIALDYMQCTCHIYLRNLSLLLALICAYTIYLLAEYSYDTSELAYERWDRIGSRDLARVSALDGDGIRGIPGVHGLQRALQ